MQSEIPSGIGKLVKLEQLLLQRSGFYGEIPNSMVELKDLTIVDLSQNNLTSVLQKNLFGSFFIKYTAFKSQYCFIFYKVSKSKGEGKLPIYPSCAYHVTNN
ncbi:putative non-specific serine/threonine protein kinase [Helianthus annuus]|nr:putative non-specific serine/threonine protein kinase [Helianthus annuus]KAJ0880145.1 putative non-specific serine/threonine protein kinase [Helianthus annuus]